MRNPRDLMVPYRVPIMLVIVLGLGLYLRLWNIEHLFDAIHDYDPGVHALSGRFIADGYLPYRDFVSAHPPLYDLTLGVVFRIFGYDFLLVRYLSVALSGAAILLVYLLGSRLYDSRVGLIGAALFAVEPMMVYLGRRGVQEPLGILLVLVGTYLAARFIGSNRRLLLFGCGVAMGLAVSAKYVFIPVSVGVGAAVLAVSVPEVTWRLVKRVGSIRFWAEYGCLFAAMYALVFLLRLATPSYLPLPFIEPMHVAPGDIAVCLLVFVVPLLLLWRYWAPGFELLKTIRMLSDTIVQKRLWLFAAGCFVGFIVVTGYFLAVMPEEFVRQTFFLQANRPSNEFPSLVGIARVSGGVGGFLRMSLLAVLSLVPLCLLLLHKKPFSRSDCFLFVLLAVAILLSQGLSQMPRYYAPVLLLGLVGIASFSSVAASSSSTWYRVRMLGVFTVFILCVSLTVTLLGNYSAYDIGWSGKAGNRAIYDDTNEALAAAGAERVFSTNPIYQAMTTDYESSLRIDPFGLLWLARTPPEDLVLQLKAEGVDFVVFESWVRYWGPPLRTILEDLIQAVRSESSLAGLVEPGTDQMVEIYRLSGPAASLVNGDFRYWTSYQGVPYPLGWTPVLQTGLGDGASIGRGGLGTESWLQLTVYECGESGVTSSTHSGIVQKIAFPCQDILLEVMPDINTESLGETPLGPAVHFLDRQSGHSVVLGFSDELEDEEVSIADTGSSVVVRRPAPLHQWSEHRFNLMEYWGETGWPVPEEIDVLVVLSAHSDYPGYYTFHVARVETVEP
jgi:hypothetical protein